MMHESQLNDKIKYWQYHLKKNKKNQPKQPHKKIPEKKKPAVKSLYSNSNTLLNTIDKLKLYLDQTNKSKPAQFNFKKEKEGKKTHYKEIDQSKAGKSVSMQGTIKLSKSNNQKIKIQIDNNSKSKSKSRSKSKNKLIKSKKSKQIKSIKETKEAKLIKIDQIISPTRKTNKKKKNKSNEKYPLSVKINTGHIEEWQLQKRLMQTLNTKTQKSRNQTESSQFRLWEEHQQVMYNIRQRSSKTINSYFKSFVAYLSFGRIRKQQRMPLTQRYVHSPFSLSTMIRSQQSKLLQLRHQLSRLKDSNNLNESLQLIICKVNENISSLKKIEYSEKQNEKIHTTMINTQNPNNVNSFHSSNQTIRQSSQSSFSEPPEIREPILMIDSLTISQDQLTNKICPDHLKEESSINLLDSKFLNVTINNPAQFPQHEATQNINISLMKSHQAVLINYQNNSTLLLSASAKSQSKLLSEVSEQEQQNPLKMQFTINSVKFNQKEYHNEQQEDLYTEQQNARLLNSINSILTGHQIQFQLQRRQLQINKQQQGSKPNYYPSQQKHHICNRIFEDLISQIIPFLGNHQFLLQKLIQIFPNEESQPNQEYCTPIQYTNQYLLELTDSLLTFASRQFNFFQRISTPLGAQPFVNLRYIRISLIQQYMLDGFQPYGQENYQCEIDKDMQEVEAKAQILSKEHFANFGQKFSNQTIPHQFILNSCLYQAINNILDRFRPFGTNGLPVFYYYNKKFHIPSLDKIKQGVKSSLQKYMNIRLGHQNDATQTTFQIQKQITASLKSNTLLLRDEIEMDFSTQDEDSMQRYQVMLMIENYIFSQQSWIINKCLSAKM